ncbi:unnamed protein product [Closterium sp. NIES-54]
MDSLQKLRELFAQRTRLWSGAAGARDPAAGDTGVGGARVTAGAGGTGGAAAAGPGGARTRGTRAAETSSVGGAGAVGAGAGGTGAGSTGAGGAGAEGAVSGGTGAGGTVRSRPYFVPQLQQTGGRTEHRDPESRPASPVCTVRTGGWVPRPPPPPVPSTHAMTLRPSSVPSVFLCRLFLSPLFPDLESDRARAASPTISRLLASVVTDPSFDSIAASTLVAELVDFVAACRLDYATALVADSESASPPSVGGECALGTDILEDRQEDFECLADIPTPRSYAEAITGPYSSQWQAAVDAEMASWKSTTTYVDEVPPPGVNIVDGMWIFRVKRPPGSPPTFKARYVA